MLSHGNNVDYNAPNGDVMRLLVPWPLSVVLPSSARGSDLPPSLSSP